jgi:hypothetical protein
MNFRLLREDSMGRCMGVRQASLYATAWSVNSTAESEVTFVVYMHTTFPMP